MVPLASKFGFSDIIPALLAVHADIVTYKGGRMSMKDYMNYRERDILVEIRIPKREVPVAVEALRISRGDFPYLTGSIRRDDTAYEVYIGDPSRCATTSRESECFAFRKRIDALDEAARGCIRGISISKEFSCIQGISN